MKRIPRFASFEIQGITHLLGNEGLSFDFEGVVVGATGFGASTGYYLVVSEESFVDACALLMD